MTPAEDRNRRAERGALIGFYTGPVLSFEIRPPYYLASCDVCGWVGSSEHCETDTGPRDDSDCYCPRCLSPGADCGRVAELIAEPVDVAAKALAAKLEEAEAVAFMLLERRKAEPVNAARPVCGKVFMTAATAEAAAARLSNSWRIVVPMPVFAVRKDGGRS